MQVKKFEARTIKEALEMVKNTLGPDAIILSVRDNTNRFGLVGENSVELTAAVSESTLRKKKFVDTKITSRVRENFDKAPARVQKEFIDKVVRNHVASQTAKSESARRQVTARPYIEIDDDAPASARMGQSRNVSNLLAQIDKGPNPEEAMRRIRSAAREAWSAGLETVAPAAPQPSRVDPNVQQSQAEIASLKAQIASLQRVIEEFRQMPQKFVSTHPGADAGLPYELSFMYEKLSQCGFSRDNIDALLGAAKSEIPAVQLKKKPMVEAWVAQYLLTHLQIVSAPFAGKLHGFVGGAGQGKTSMLVKIASHLTIEKRRKVAVVTTDAFKIGAVEQLRIYCQILGLPLVVLRDGMSWEQTLEQLAAYDHILVDYPGLQLKDPEEIRLLSRLLPPQASAAHIHFVLSASFKDKDAFDMARRYLITGFSDVIFTCIDECTQHGLIYNFQKEFGTPLHSFGIGAQVPEDFEEASKERVLDLIFKISSQQPKVGSHAS